MYFIRMTYCTCLVNACDISFSSFLVFLMSLVLNLLKATYSQRVVSLWSYPQKNVPNQYFQLFPTFISLRDGFFRNEIHTKITQIMFWLIYHLWYHLVKTSKIHSIFYFEMKKCLLLEIYLNILDLELEGRHHSGIDDCKNIARICTKMLEDGWIDSIFSIIILVYSYHLWMIMSHEYQACLFQDSE